MRVEKQFLIDVFRCIGCDTCSVACKMENGLPVARTGCAFLTRSSAPSSTSPWVPTRS